MKRGQRKQNTILLLLMAYFAGAISMLLFLTPGKLDIDKLRNSEQRKEIADFEKAAEKIEEMTNEALLHFYHSRRYIKDKPQEDMVSDNSASH